VLLDFVLEFVDNLLFSFLVFFTGLDSRRIARCLPGSSFVHNGGGPRGGRGVREIQWGLVPLAQWVYMQRL
jgi:hypothetical protein